MATGWGELNLEWSNYGTTPIVVDFSLAGTSSITHADLVASGADVLILSDPAGGGVQFSLQEMHAVDRYAREGHGLLGTFKVFRWSGTDNTALAASFGLRADVEYTDLFIAPVSNRFVTLQASPLFTGLRPEGWTSSGYAYTEGMLNYPRWDQIDLMGAQLLAQCDSFTAMVSLYRAPTYAAVYVSNMPEYFGSAVDKQLLYNAITLVGQ